MAKLHFDTIDDVLAHRFVGNHADDGDTFEAIAEFVRSTTKFSEVRKALNHMWVAGMGESEGTDEDVTSEYLDVIEHARRPKGAGIFTGRTSNPIQLNSDAADIWTGCVVPLGTEVVVTFGAGKSLGEATALVNGVAHNFDIRRQELILFDQE